MSSHPPRKKLCQMSIKSMLKPLTTRGTPESESKSYPSSLPPLDRESMEAAKPHSSGSKQCSEPSEVDSKDLGAKMKDDVCKEYVREEPSRNHSASQHVREEQSSKYSAGQHVREVHNRKHSAGHHTREDPPSRHPSSHIDSDMTCEKTENLCKKRNRLPTNDMTKEGDACGSKSDPSLCPAAQSKGKGLSKSYLQRESPVKMKPSRSSQGSEGDRSKERHPDVRDLLAKAAERRMGAAAKPPRKAKDTASTADGSGRDSEEKEWRGVPLSSLPRLSATNSNMPPVTPSPDHTVLVRLPVPHDAAPLPYPATPFDAWDQCHVRMPCSPKSQYPRNKDTVVPRWSVITEALSQPINCVDDLERAVLEYNSRYASKWKFRGLHILLEEEFEEEESAHFFNKTLPAMVQLALRLPQVVTQPPPLLLQGTNHSVTLSQMQIACLLANAFFCTFPRRNAKGNDTEYAKYPDINFNRLFFHKEQRSLEKLKCILYYFKRITTNPPTGTVTFSRQTVAHQETPTWTTSKRPLPRLHVSSGGLIEEATGLLQVDFANKYLGGGVLGLGCVQEEIRFVLCPELIVSRLFTQALEKTDALVITGCEQYSRGSGYASTFCWDGPFEDTTPVDAWGRRLCQVTAIDALHFTKQPSIQYRPTYIIRELNKAYAGFRVLKGSPGVPTAVATGNWGCGAFKGNPRLKALIQLAVCGYIGRDLAYFTFGDDKLRDDLFTMFVFLKENNVTVGELAQALNHHGCREGSDGSDLFQYVCHSLGSYDSDTDPEEDKDATDARGEATTNKCQSSDVASPPANLQHSKKSPRPPSTKDALPEPCTDQQHKLSEEEILQVLSECDRLLESEIKKKQLPGLKLDSSPQKTECERRVDDLNIEVKKEGRPLQSGSESSSRLFSLLDEIDRTVNK